MLSPLAVQYILTALQLLPGIVAAGADLVSETKALETQIAAFQADKRDPTAAEWAAQNQRLSASVQALLAQKQGQAA